MQPRLCRFSWVAMVAAGVGLWAMPCHAGQGPRPNVILILTDDQGYGDLGFYGNPVLKTPHLDAMASRSVVLPYFYVSPVCAPTRACLMTGRYNYRTRAIDTFRGRAMMDPSEVTIAEIVGQAGYGTGIFGKWHLGDTYPMRPQDQGFDAALVHRGGGIAQPSDPPGGEGRYTDPILFRNGRAEATKGYCTDVYFREGMKWAESVAHQGRPFFLYLPTNAPHGPYRDVPADKLAYYQAQTIAPDRFPKTPGHPVPKRLNADVLARVYAMISNIDDNVGRLFAWLDQEKLTGNTLVIFMTDNGEATVGYNAGLRGQKSTVYEGGIRSPMFAHWPGRLKPGPGPDRIAAHIDILPTVLEVCGVPLPKGLKIDGRSILPLLEGRAAGWPERTLFAQSHRGDQPVKYHNMAVRTQQWKLVHNSGFGKEEFSGEPRFELFDMAADPYETRDVAAEHAQVVQDLKRRYEAWFADVGSTRPDNYAPPRIPLGTPHEDPVILTRQDWRGSGWAPRDCGHWEVEVAAAGQYDVRLRFRAPERKASAHFALAGKSLDRPVAAGEGTVLFSGVELPAGPARLEAWIAEDGSRVGVMFVEVSRSPAR